MYIGRGAYRAAASTNLKKICVYKYIYIIKIVYMTVSNISFDFSLHPKLTAEPC
jgi:hypothetical protein